MSSRIVLNERSYHGSGAIQDIASESKSRGFKKAFICSDPDLIKFNITDKVRKCRNRVRNIFSNTSKPYYRKCSIRCRGFQKIRC